MKKPGFFILMLIASFCLSSCAETKTIDELIEEAIQKKVNELQVRKTKECWEFIYEEAESLVDSIMYQEIGNTMNDSLLLPDRPERPGDSTGYQVELDSSEIHMILIDSLDPEQQVEGIDSLKIDPILFDSTTNSLK